LRDFILWYDSGYGEDMKDVMSDKITIIEGPPPTFETVQDGWALGLNEGPYLYDLALTRLRAFNGAALVERCHRAWHNNGTIQLEYRDEAGLEENAPILAARNVQGSDGDVLFLWVRREPEDLEEDFDEDDSDPADDSFDTNIG
jgi:hypothetical protein